MQERRQAGLRCDDVPEEDISGSRHPARLLRTTEFDRQDGASRDIATRGSYSAGTWCSASGDGLLLCCAAKTAWMARNVAPTAPRAWAINACCASVQPPTPSWGPVTRRRHAEAARLRLRHAQPVDDLPGDPIAWPAAAQDNQSVNRQSQAHRAGGMRPTPAVVLTGP